MAAQERAYQLPRRLVAVGDRVYATLGLDAPLSVLDAATGKTIRTEAGTEHTDEIIASDKTLFLLVGHAPNAWQTYRDIYSYTWSNTNHANKDWAWDQAEPPIMALDAETGKVLWKQPRRAAPLTLAADAQRLYFYDGQKVEALDRRSGKIAVGLRTAGSQTSFPDGIRPDAGGAARGRDAVGGPPHDDCLLGRRRQEASGRRNTITADTPRPTTCW